VKITYRPVFTTVFLVCTVGLAITVVVNAVVTDFCAAASRACLAFGPVFTAAVLVNSIALNVTCAGIDVRIGIVAIY
jgi:hypothetical protein